MNKLKENKNLITEIIRKVEESEINTMIYRKLVNHTAENEAFKIVIDQLEIITKLRELSSILVTASKSAAEVLSLIEMSDICDTMEDPRESARYFIFDNQGDIHEATREQYEEVTPVSEDVVSL